MAEKHPCFPEPDNLNVKLWRYLDLSKFLSLLKTQQLYFARSDLLGDPHEGANTIAGKMSLAVFEDMLLKRRHEQPDLEPYKPLTDVQVRELIAMQNASPKRMRRFLHISCWHMNEQESFAMWKIYTASTDSVCIQTTFSKLANALPNNCYLGKVTYLDYFRDLIPGGNAFYPVMHKRHHFDYEQEVRAIVCNLDDQAAHGENPPTGVSVRINVAEIVEQVLVNPFSPGWFAEIVKDLCKRYELPSPVRQSALSFPVA
jgi:hypothetical protein